MEKFINQSPLFLVIICLIIGFAFLMKGADYFVEGSSSVAKRLKVPSIIIGLTIVAMGTSLPETAVSVTASIANNNALAISNVVGSNIFNMMFVIGVCSILATIGVKRETIIRDIPLSLVCATLLLIFGYLAFGDRSHMILGRFDGIIFLIILILFKSPTIPIILVGVIEFAIFVNMGIPYYTGSTLPFVASIVIGTIQLGATVDYAILMTTRYKRERNHGAGKYDAITTAHKASAQSIIVLSLIHI